MIDGNAFLHICLDISIIVLVISFFITSVRVLIGPSIVDRVLALDMLVGIAIGFIAVYGLKTGYTLYVDIAIALGLVGFLATVAFARFILISGRISHSADNADAKPSKAKKPAAKKPAAKKPAAKKPAAGKSKAKTGAKS